MLRPPQGPGEGRVRKGGWSLFQWVYSLTHSYSGVLGQEENWCRFWEDLCHEGPEKGELVFALLTVGHLSGYLAATKS